MRQSTRFYSILSIFVFVTVAWHLSLTGAQEAAPVQACDNVDYLMRQNTTPARLLKGGGALTSGQEREGSLSGEDMGDIWAFNASGGIAAVTFDDVPADVPLEFAVYAGLEPITQGLSNPYLPVENAVAVQVNLPASAVYTLVVQLVNPAQMTTLDTSSYRLSATFSGSGGVASGVVPVGDAAASTRTIENIALVDAYQTFTFPNGTVMNFNVNGIKQISLVDPRLSNMYFFAPQAQLILGDWVNEIDLVGGSLSVTGDSNRTFFLENFGYEAPFGNVDLKALKDSLGTEFATDWNGVAGVWMMSDCIGILLSDARTFTIAADPSVAGRQLLTSDADNTQTTYACANTYLRFDTPDTLANTARHELCLDWSGVMPNETTRFIGGVFSTRLLGERRLELSGTQLDIAVAPLTAADTVYPVTVTVNDTTTLTSDWFHLSGLRLVDDLITFTFMDDPLRDGQSTSRAAVGLQTVTAVQDVIEMVYADTRRLLILPADDGYLEVITPSEEPTFYGAPYDSAQLPNQAGFVAHASNNLGGECYKLTTVLPELNCAPNGTLNPDNGNFWLSMTDLSAAYPVMNLALTRTYNTANALQDSAFGLGWTSNLPLEYRAAYDASALSRPIDFSTAAVGYNAALNIGWASSGVVIYTSASGSQHPFVRQDQRDRDVYTTFDMPGWTLWREGTTPVEWVRSGWTLRYDDGYTAQFDRAGRLRTFGYPAQGHRVQIAYDNTSEQGAANQTVTLTDNATDRHLQLEFDAQSHVIRAEIRDLTQSQSGACETAQNCFETRYTYTQGLLTQVTYPNGQIGLYRYDEMGRLIAFEDAHAPVLPKMGLTYSDDGTATGLYVLNAMEDLPGETSLAYQTLQRTTSGSERQGTLTDLDGNPRQWVYRLVNDEALNRPATSDQLLSISNPLAGTGDPLADTEQEYTWDAINNKITLNNTTARNSNTIAFQDGGHLEAISGNQPSVALSYITSVLNVSPVALELAERIDFADGTNQAYQYDANGQLSNFTSRDGMVYGLQRGANGRLAVLTRADGVVWNYVYDASGFVKTITQVSAVPDDAGYSVTYTWDALGQLIGVEDSVLGTYGIQYTYNQDTTTISITDPAGAVQTAIFDPFDRLIETNLRASGTASDFLRQTTYTYYTPAEDARQRLQSVTQHNGDQSQTTTYAYSFQPLLTDPTAQNTFDPAPIINGTLTTITDPYGRKNFMLVDALGRVRLTADDMQNVSRYDYAIPTTNIEPNPNNGIMVTQTDYFAGKNIGTVRYTFDTTWQLVNVLQRQGTADRVVWEGEWRLFMATINASAPTTRLRSLESLGTGLATVDWSQDPGAPNYQNGKPSQITIDRREAGAPTEAQMSATYDALGRVIRVSSFATGAEQITEVQYCPLAGGALKTIRSAAPVTCEESGDLALTTDAHQRLSAVQDAFGTRTYTYAPNTDTGGLTVTVTADAFTWLLEYNAAGDLVSWSDESGFTRTYTTDMLGRLVNVIVPDTVGASFTFRYNLANLLTRQEDDLGRVTAYTYNAFGQLLSEQNLQTGDLTSYAYNSQGLLNSVISPLGSVTTYTYDENGADPKRIAEIITPTGRNTFTWDDANNQLSHTDARAYVTTYQYDSLGFLWGITNPEGRVHTLGWDEMGQLTRWSTVEAETTRDLALTHDNTARSLTLSAPATPDWGWTFDFSPQNVLQSVTNSAQNALTLAYDPFGRISTLTTGDEAFAWEWQRTPATNTVTVAAADNISTTYTYDALYRQLTAASGSATAQIEHVNVGEKIEIVAVQTATDQRIYLIDPVGNSGIPRIILFTAGEKREYIYDIEGRLESINQEICLEAPFTALSTDLSVNTTPCEKRTQKSWFASTRFSYSPNGLPIRTVDKEQNTETFSYDSNGNLIAYQNANSQTFTYAYDGLNRLTRLTTPAGFDLIVSYALEGVSGVCQAPSIPALAYADCVTSGGVVETFGYDGVGRLTVINYPDGATIPLEYAPEGAGQLTKKGDLVLRYADNGLAWLTQLADDPVTLDSLQRVTSVGTLQHTYDDAGRLIRISSDTNTLAIAYAEDQLGYTLTDEKSQASVTIRLNENGTLAEVLRSDASVLNVQGWSQEASGRLRFLLNWENYALDYIVSRTDNVLRIGYSEPFLQLDYTLNPAGEVRRETISSDSIRLNGSTADESLTDVLVSIGYNLNNKPLTMRINDRNSEAIYYQATFVYNDCGQITKETRQYADGTQATLEYAYGLAGVGCGAQKQLQSRTLTLNPTGDAPASTLTFAYAYASNGNLQSISSNGEECKRYTYDSANRVRSAQLNGQNTDYGYDAYNRLIQAGSRTFAYVGNQTTPFASVDGSTTQYTLTTDEGIGLFSFSGTAVTPVIDSGQGQTLGTRPLDNTQTTQDVWLFDPLGRYISIAAPTVAADEPCGWLLLQNAPANSQPFTERVWDSTNDLFFIQGRAYTPQEGIFLQPAALDVQGNVYDAAEGAAPLISAQQQGNFDGISALYLAQQMQNKSGGYSAQTILSQFMPVPAGTASTETADRLNISAQPADSVVNLYNLPAWLTSAYNLSAPRVDGRTGALALSRTQAPGQSYEQVTPLLDFSGLIWRTTPIWLPAKPQTAFALLPQWITPREPLAYRDFVTDAWKSDVLTLGDVLQTPVTILQTLPSDVLAYLPRPLASADNSHTTLQLLATVDALLHTSGSTLLEQIMAVALPTLPTLPPDSTADWGRAYFSDDAFGLQDAMNPASLPELPAIPLPLWNSDQF